MIAKSRTAAIKIVAVYWTLLILGMVTYTSLRLDAVAQLEPVWTGAIGGSALGQLLAAKRYRMWVATMIVLAIALFLLPQMPLELGGKRLWLAFLPAALCGYWSLGDRTSLAAFWFPAMIWMLSILDGTHANSLPGREGLILFAALTALFVVYLRVREERRVALWQTVAPEPIAASKPAVIVQDRAVAQVASGVWAVLVTGLGFGVTAWLAPLLWQPEVNAGGHSTARTLDVAYRTATARYVATHQTGTGHAVPVTSPPTFVVSGNYVEDSNPDTATSSTVAYTPAPKLPCCPLEDDVYTKHVRVKEFLALGRSDEETEHKPKFACRACSYEERYQAEHVAYADGAYESGGVAVDGRGVTAEAPDVWAADTTGVDVSGAPLGEGTAAVGGGTLAVGSEGHGRAGARTDAAGTPSASADSGEVDMARERAALERPIADRRRDDVGRDNASPDSAVMNVASATNANGVSNVKSVSRVQSGSSTNTASTNTASTNTASTNAASTNAASTNAASTNAASTNAASTNTASSNTASSNTASTNTSNTNPANTNTANTNTANTNTANTNTANTNTANTNTANTNTANTNTANTNTANTNTANTNTANTNTASTNAANTNAANTNTASTNTASTNTASTNTASTNTASTNTASTNTTAAGVAHRPADDSSSSFLHWIVLLTASLFATQLIALALRPVRRAIALRHLRRPYWQETVDQRISNSWQLVLVGLRDAGWRADSTESPRELARRVGIEGVERCATILDRARHGIRIDREDLDDMTSTADTAYRDARKQVRGMGRAASWLRWPLV